MALAFCRAAEQGKAGEASAECQRIGTGPVDGKARPVIGKRRKGVRCGTQRRPHTQSLARAGVVGRCSQQHRSIARIAHPPSCRALEDRVVALLGDVAAEQHRDDDAPRTAIVREPRRGPVTRPGNSG